MSANFRHLATGLIAIAVASAGSKAATLYSETFESAFPGTFTEADNGTVVTAANNAQGGAIPGTSASFNDTTATAEGKLTNDAAFTLGSDKFFQVSFDFFEVAGVGDATAADSARFRVGSSNTNGNTLIDIGLANGSTFYVSNSTGTVTNGAAGIYSTGQLHSVVAVINIGTTSEIYGGSNSVAASRFDLWVGGQRAINDGTFRNAIASPDGLSFNSFASSINAFYIDNVKVDGDVLVPEPAGLWLLALAGLVMVRRQER